MSIRRRFNDVIEFNNENKEKLLDFLNDYPVLYKSIQACILIENNQLEFNDSMNSLNLYEIYILIKKFIKDILIRFFPDIYITNDKDLYFEILCSNVSEDKIQTYIDSIKEDFYKDDILSKIKKEQKRKLKIIDFKLLSEKKIDNFRNCSLILDEIGKIIKRFLYNFNNRKINFDFQIYNDSISLEIFERLE